MKQVNLGIIGLGFIGQDHLGRLVDDKEVNIAAVCDFSKPVAMQTAEKYRCEPFTDPAKLVESGYCDAVLIATPHYSHTDIGIMALEAGLHVLVEKPISVHKADCLKLLAAHKNTKQVFGAVFTERANPLYREIKRLLDENIIGPVTRINWIITNWFRPDVYYASGSWRATWAGEGGGVLLNQCPHNLDLLQWFCGMPSDIRAVCRLGKWHDIEVEDDVSAFMEYDSGATGVFVTGTGEAPGTNRLEITGDKGKIVFENDRIELTVTDMPVSEFRKTTREKFGVPGTDAKILKTASLEVVERQRIIEKNFISAILRGEKLIAPAAEGIRSVELANAMLLSSMKNKPVKIPMDAKEYADLLGKLVANSRFQKK